MDDYQYNQITIKLNKIIERLERIENGLFGKRKIVDTTSPPIYREHWPPGSVLVQKEEPYP